MIPVTIDARSYRYWQLVVPQNGRVSVVYTALAPLYPFIYAAGVFELWRSGQRLTPYWMKAQAAALNEQVPVTPGVWYVILWNENPFQVTVNVNIATVNPLAWLPTTGSY